MSSLFPLLLLTLVAAAFMLWPLWRYSGAEKSGKKNLGMSREKSADLVQIFRENLADLQAQLARGVLSDDAFANLKVELERNLLRDHQAILHHEKPTAKKNLFSLALIFVAAALLISIFAYWQFGAWPDVKIQRMQQEKMQADYQDMLQNKEPDRARALALANEYAKRLQDKPNHLQYLFLLARLHMDLGQYSDAVDIYQKIIKLDTESSLILAELAQAMFLRDGNHLSNEALAFVQRSLVLDAKNSTALGLMGLNAYSNKDFKSAVNYWRKALAVLDKESPSGKFWAAAIEKAKQVYVESGGKAEDLDAHSPYTLQLQVSLASNVKVPADSIVFIYARVWQGTPMPLAIARIKAGDLPQEVLLDETMAMSPMSSLATAEKVEVIARVSQEGSAQAKAGDWQASLGPIDMKAISNPIRLEISQQIPSP